MASLAVAAHGLLIATRAVAARVAAARVLHRAPRDFDNSDEFLFATVRRSRARRRKVVVRIFRRRLFRLSLNSSFDGNIQYVDCFEDVLQFLCFVACHAVLQFICFPFSKATFGNVVVERVRWHRCHRWRWRPSLHRRSCVQLRCLHRSLPLCCL